MKIGLAVTFFLLVFSFTYFPTSFGDHVKAEIEILDAKSLLSSEVTGDIGTEIIWTNHTSESINITSGNPRHGPDGLFEVTLLNPGESFSYKYDEESIEREPFTHKEWYSQTHHNISGVVVIQVGEHSHEDGAHEHGTPKDKVEAEYTNIDDLVKFQWQQFLKKLASATNQ
tara:strand:- start:677 stop:1189 length:513 start_codon:yes stop_codon:yes gene_type:complete